MYIYVGCVSVPNFVVSSWLSGLARFGCNSGQHREVDVCHRRCEAVLLATGISAKNARNGRNGNHELQQGRVNIYIMIYI